LNSDNEAILPVSTLTSRNLRLSLMGLPVLHEISPLASDAVACVMLEQ
jgi:hypothetical protein